MKKKKRLTKKDIESKSSILEKSNSREWKKKVLLLLENYDKYNLEGNKYGR